MQLQVSHQPHTLKPTRSPTWLAPAGALPSAWDEVHKATQPIKCLQPLLPQRWVPPQMAAVQ